MKQQVTIQALNLQGSPIGGFKNVICLYLNSIDDPCPIHYTEEKENGIYVFTIDEDINTLSQVFVQLSQDKPLQEKIGSTYQTITYLKKPYFPHPTCMQINTLECMIHNDKIVPYTFAPYGKSPIITMLKAYKLPISSQARPIGCEFANTLQSYKEDWRNEIYTIDSEQIIRLQAFVGNTTASKTIQEDMAEIDVSQIKWGYTLIKAGAKQSLKEYPAVHKERDITPLKDKSGTNILFSLKEIAQAYQPNTSPYANDGNSIVIFAYVKDSTEKILHLDYRNTDGERVTTIQSIELKILSSRFYLHYDGEMLEFLENERVLCAIEERAQDIQKNLGQEIALFLRGHIQHKADSRTSSHTSESTASESAHPIQADHILQDGAYTLSHEDSMFELFKQASYSPYLSPEARHSLKALLDEYAKPLSSLKSLELVVAHNKDIIIETERYYEDTNLTASRFRIRVRNPNLLKCPSHKDASESSPDSEIRECKDCQALREFAQWDNHYFLERSGYDCITPELELRIPEGRYELRWRYSGVSFKPSGEFKKLSQKKQSGTRKPLLNLSNHYISPKRAIMLHVGFDVAWSKGCLLFADALNPNDSQPKNIVGNAKAIDDPEQKQEEHSNTFANKLLNFLIQDEVIRDSFSKAKDDGVGLAIPNVSFIIRNKFGERRESKGTVSQYKSPITLSFNGKSLTMIIRTDNQIESISFQAVSGRAQKVGDKHYFTHEKERQMLKNEGPIPEGEYYITPLSENIDDGVQEWNNLTNTDKLLAYIGRGKWGGRIYNWGTIRIPIQPKIVTLTDSKGQAITRNNFFIHGGAEAGSAGCIDLWDKNELFFEKFLHYVEKYKDEILNNQGKIPLINCRI